MKNHQVSEYLFNRIVEVARNYPQDEDPFQRTWDKLIQAWEANLRLYLTQVAAEAWVKGAQWAAGRQVEAKYIVVTTEQYEALKGEANG